MTSASMTTITHPSVILLEKMQQWEGWSDIQKVAYKEYGMSAETFEKALPEYQKFLALLTCHAGLDMTSEVVDKIWHAHVLHTSLYGPFCDTFFGRFIHHIPNLESQGVDCQTNPPICSNIPCATQCKTPRPPEDTVPFRQAYEAVFGSLPEIWNSKSDGRAFLVK
jgi:hypothetical protein